MVSELEMKDPGYVSRCRDWAKGCVHVNAGLIAAGGILSFRTVNKIATKIIIIIIIIMMFIDCKWATVTLLMSPFLRPSVRPHGTTRLPPDRFS